MKYIFEYNPNNLDTSVSVADGQAELYANSLVELAKKEEKYHAIVNNELVILWIKVLVKEKHLDYKEVGIKIGELMYSLNKDGLTTSPPLNQGPWIEALRRLNARTPK